MPVWRPAPVEERPVLTLANWRVIETECGELHFVGRNVETGSGRVSSAIVAFGIEDRLGRTQTGRVYQLEGPPGRDDNADYVLGVWLQVNEVLSWTDVTESIVLGPE